MLFRSRVKYHYVIVDYVCRLKRGRLKPASDVVDARWVRREEMPQYHLTEMATKVILKAFEVVKKRRFPRAPRQRGSPAW